MFEHSFRVGRRRPAQEQVFHNFRICCRQPGIAAARHDGCQRFYPLRMSDCQQLRNHAAHRRADDVRRSDPEGIEHAGGIVCHVVERIRRIQADAKNVVHRVAQPARRAHAVELGGQADVAVVEAHDVVAVACQRIAKIR